MYTATLHAVYYRLCMLYTTGYDCAYMLYTTGYACCILQVMIVLTCCILQVMHAVYYRL